MKIKLILLSALASIILYSCDNDPHNPQTNFDAVKYEFPHGEIYSENPNTSNQDCIVINNSKVYSVHVEFRAIKYSNLLSIRYDGGTQEYQDTTSRVKQDTMHHISDTTKK